MNLEGGARARSVKIVMQGTQIDNPPLEKVSTTGKFLMPTVIENMESVVLVDFEYSRKIKIKSFSSDYQDTDAREKDNDFLGEYPSISAVFSIKTLMDEIELVVAQNYK